MPSVNNNNVYTILPVTCIPAGHKNIGSRLIYMAKAYRSHNGRVVALRRRQAPGIDCDSTFGPVDRLKSIRMVLAMAAEYNLECWQLDNTAFLNADVADEA